MVKKEISFRVFGLVYLLIATAIVAYPLFLTLMRSLENDGFGNYTYVLSKVNIFRNFWNSVRVTGVTLIGVGFICSLGAFAFSKLNFRGRNVLFVFVLMGILIPTSATIFPLFQVIKMLKLVNNPLSQTLPYITTNSIFGLLLLKLYFDGLPDEMMESARIDGAGSFRIFARIMLPNALPGFSILFVNTFKGAWNEFQIAITFVTRREYFTMAALPINFRGTEGSYQNVISALFACLIMCIIPVIVFYILAQKLIIKGMTEGAIKG